ncbi:MAG: hypothetical protein ACUVX8_19400, partial [Candidatus Zipacnadales bacterium]
MRLLLVIWVLLICLTSAALATSKVLIETDFGAATVPVLTDGNRANERVTGVMVGDWRDNSAWSSQVFAHWEQLEEEGRRFLRLTVTQVGEHWYQFRHSLPRIEEESFYRLSFTARSADEAMVRFGIRAVGPPYT